tara:strand:+ start:1950 stop:3314 length:1365 start_codon:yes stop_codon:yes gene_type:complete
MINPYIFREYDIRGEVKADFTEEVVIKLGRAFGTYVKRNGSQEISLSGDVRLTTPELLQSFKQGVLSTGIDVINLGILPTPVNYYSMFHLGISGAAQITGSHNPPEFNGFKLSYDKKAVYGKAIQKLYELIDKNDFEQGKGTETRYNILPSYKKMILSKITLDRHMKVVLDCGNAAGCINAPDIFKSLDLDLLELFCEKDGTFPNHHPDPSVKSNLNELTKKMKTGKYDIGIAFDGDADRIGVIDEKGDMLWADQIIALFLPEIIKNGETILFDVKCSQALEDMIKKYGGNPVMWKTGHSLIKEKMIELGCKLGGEMSGHIFFADDYFGYDDAIYVAARLIQMLSKTKKTLSDLKSELPVYHSTPELRLEIENDKEKFRMADQAISYFKKNYNCITVDGVRIKFSDGWALVRQSNTQPVIVCRFEAKTAERMDEIKNLVMDKLREFGSFSLGGH